MFNTVAYLRMYKILREWINVIKLPVNPFQNQHSDGCMCGCICKICIFYNAYHKIITSKTCFNIKYIFRYFLF